jgi:hypothetical protein
MYGSLVLFVVIWYIFPILVCLDQEKSGNRASHLSVCRFNEGCQMVYLFQTKNPNSGKFWRTFGWKMLIYFTAVWNILRIFVFL